MGFSDFVDPYLDAETGVLRNKVGARTRKELEEAEGTLSFARLIQLLDHPCEPTGDLSELQAIHYQLFQDVYSWAGHVRTVDLVKNVDGAEPFMPVSLIQQASVYAASELHADHDLQKMDRHTFIGRLAYHYDQFNYLHPFREGNGRTQRVFWNRIAHDAGWRLDWREIQGAVNDQACRAASEQRDFEPLMTMFLSLVSRSESFESQPVELG